MEQLRFASDEIEVVVLPESGARLHRLRAFGVDLLRTPDDDAVHRSDPIFWGAYVMAPWCNRAAPGPTMVAGRRVDLAPNFPDGTAIHGLVFDRPWTVEGDGSLMVRVADHAGWPWPFEVRARVAVSASAVRLEYALVNTGDAPMPAGLGLHPWFRAPVAVALHARSVYDSNTNAPRVKSPAVGRFDLDRLGPMPEGLDATWTDLGDPPIDLAWPGDGVRATIATNRRELHVAAASPPGKDAIAVEPQTHAPDGLRRLAEDLPGGVALIQPAASLELEIRLRVQRDPH